jgi:hypothetical protein
LILKVFPSGKLRVEALARAAAVTILWDTCREAPARRAAVEFVAFMDRNDASLRGTEEQQNTLKSLVLNGVGIPVSVSDDFGVGLFDPANPNPTLVKTLNSQALVQLDAGSFLEPTVITISRLADNFQLTNFAGDQFPPKYDYNAVNSSGIHVLQEGKTAIVAFCLLSLEEDGEPDVYPPGGYPENRRIGHNPVPGAPGFPFEILEAVDLGEAGLADDLDCPTEIGSFGGGETGFADAGLGRASRFLGRVFLPRALWAATLAKLPPPPPLGGKAGSLSPFAVVEGEPELEFDLTSDPSDLTFFTLSNPTLRWNCEGDFCEYPTVLVLDGETGVEGVDVTVTLLPGEGSTGEFTEGSTTTVTTDINGQAMFDNLSITEAGGYSLRFEADGATPLETLGFSVEAGD